MLGNAELLIGIASQERGNSAVFKHKSHTLNFKLDNEFDLIFVAVYQSIVQLSYVDKLLSDVQLEFRDRYRTQLINSASNLYHLRSCENGFAQFTPVFNKLMKLAIEHGNKEMAKPTVMRSFQESDTYKKTVKSMIIDQSKPKVDAQKAGAQKITQNSKIPKVQQNKGAAIQKENSVGNIENETPKNTENGNAEVDDIAKKREEFMLKMMRGGKKAPPKKETKPDETIGKGGKKGKAARVWDLSGKNSDAAVLDFSCDKDTAQNGNNTDAKGGAEFMEKHRKLVGTMRGDLRGLDENEDLESDELDDVELMSQSKQNAGSRGGLFSAFQSLVGSKTLSEADIQPALDKMRDHLINKNVAAEPAQKLCDSVMNKLTGKTLGTFTTVANTVKATLRESLVQILSPKRRVDILRDVLEAKSQHRPYVIVFCGVNGVGKSTNLAKIAFWLTENRLRVLIAAGDTFRAGAVEQLRTHMRHLNALHNDDSVHLYEQGYGKDPASIAQHAISHANDKKFDVVLVDTAGRMQDNEPLMRALAKLIKVNEPDSVLFVGEALVGNEAVDQLVKFNQALLDHAVPGTQGRTIDGIVLTKFDTIDDKVGAAISMTYITGQPIVFVGTGQTYADLKVLNANAVVNALMK